MVRLSRVDPSRAARAQRVGIPHRLQRFIGLKLFAIVFAEESILVASKLNGKIRKYLFWKDIFRLPELLLITVF